MTTTQHRPLVRPRFIRWAIVVFVILLPILAFNIWDSIEAHKLKDAIDAIRASGEPATTWDLELHDAPLTPGAPEPVPGNAAPYYLAAAALVHYAPAGRVPIQYPGVSTARIGLLSPAMAQALKSGSTDANMLAAAHDLVMPNDDAFKMLDRATSLRFTSFAPGTDYSALRAQLTRLFDLSGFRTTTLLLNNDVAGAVASLRTELGLVGGRHRPLTGFEYSNVGQPLTTITRLAFILGRPALGESDLESLEPYLRAADDDDRIAWHVLNSRAFEIDEGIELLRGYGLTANLSDVPTTPSRLPVSTWVLRPFLAFGLLQYLPADSQRLAAARRPWPDRIDAFGDVVGPPPSWIERIIVPETALQYTNRRPMQMRWATMMANDIAVVRCARVAVAIERYRRVHDDQLPNMLTDLTPGLIDTMPIDPFSGKPLLYKRTATGYIVYSVGANRVDDGGVIQDPADLLAKGAPSSYDPPKGDIGVQIEHKK